jgi:predicted phosphodiesterase
MPGRYDGSILTVSCPGASRVAISSDTHGRLDPRIAGVVASCDCAVHAGDIGAAVMLAALQPFMKTVVAVLGNNDVAGNSTRTIGRCVRCRSRRDSNSRADCW